jgi:hypothetical protein
MRIHVVSLVIRSRILNSWDRNAGARSQHKHQYKQRKQTQPQTPPNYDARDEVTTRENVFRCTGWSSLPHTSGTNPLSLSATSVNINHTCFRYTELRKPLCKDDITLPDIIVHKFHNFSLSLIMLTYALLHNIYLHLLPQFIILNSSTIWHYE